MNYRRTPPKYARGTSDYDRHSGSGSYYERERDERMGCLTLILMAIGWIVFLAILGSN